MRWTLAAATAAALSACASSDPEWPLAGPPVPREPRPPQVWDAPPGPADTTKHPREAAALRVYLGHVLEQYRADNGMYPTTDEGMIALFAKPVGRDRWKGPYLEGMPPVVDPWGREFLYKSDGLTYQLVSAGGDGVFGTADDIGENK
jgi:type II secretion system protein G